MTAARPSREVGWAEPSFLVAIIGLGLSTYLTIEHFTTSALLACPESATINCQKVTTSKWSHIAGIPVAVLGLVYFAAIVVLMSPPLWRRVALDPLRIAGAGLGVAMALYLVYIELYKVNAICLYCTGVHICTVLLLAAVLWRTSAATSR